MALWEVVTGRYILGISWCNLLCLHPALANTSAGGHSVGLSWLRGDLGEAFHGEVPVCPGHPWSMPSLVWPPLLSQLVHCAKNGVFPHNFYKFGYPGLAEGNVIDSHIQFDFPRSS